MARKDTRYKAKSDYSLLRKKHKMIAEGTIYENDLMTISKMDELFTDQIPLYSDGNFKFTVRVGSNLQRKHYRGAWDCPENTSGDSCEWTLDNINDAPEVKTSESVVKLNPDYTSLKDFAYYGSAVELFQASVNDIMMNFPGELYFSEMDAIIDGITYKVVENDYSIDVDSLSLPDGSVNEMRYFCKSADKYVIYPVGSEPIDLSTCEVAWEATPIAASCKEKKEYTGAWISTIKLCDGMFTIYARLADGAVSLYYKDVTGKTESGAEMTLAGTRVRPNTEIVESYFNNLDVFERVLLNRDTNPIYQATFETYTDTEKGTYSKLTSFVWPSSRGFNPDTFGGGFQSYITRMLNVCEYHDAKYCDVIWRKLTHESIKNLDWTFTREVGDEEEVYEDIDSTRISAICRLYGRQFDDLKMYIDQIKRANNISYNGKGNAVDYVLSDILETKGIEAQNLNITNDNTVETDQLYKALNKRYTSSDANVEFTKRLALNAKYLSSIKGTRKGIETILALLGFDKDEYVLNEYVVVASGRSDYEHFTSNTEAQAGIVNYPLYEDIGYINKYRDSLYSFSDFEDEEGIEIEKLPLAKISIEYGDDELSYVIPWFSKDKVYDGNLYFQQKGGWKRVTKKSIDLSIAPSVSCITSSNLFTMYGETMPSMKFARTINDMLEFSLATVETGDICYVSDISDISDIYNFESQEEKEEFENGNFSNYFILVDSEYSTWAGMYDGTSVFGKYGWKNILISEYDTTQENLTENGKRVIYYESIKDDTLGNNPHGGHNEYDEGSSYVVALTKPFKWAVQNEDFSWFSDEHAEIFEDYGFEPEWYVDNQKCWYFSDTTKENNNMYVAVNEQYIEETKNFYNGIIDELRG